MSFFSGKYLYMVTYIYSTKNNTTGQGRMFAELTYKIRSQTDVESVERFILEENEHQEFENVIATNFNLLPKGVGKSA